MTDHVFAAAISPDGTLVAAGRLRWRSEDLEDGRHGSGEGLQRLARLRAARPADAAEEVMTRRLMPNWKLVHEEIFPACAGAGYSIAAQAHAIRVWWEAARVIVIAQPNGIWTAACGESEDAPDYTTSAVLSTFDPPRRSVHVGAALSNKGRPSAVPGRLRHHF